MGKIKNFRVNLPYEYARDKKWIDENLKPGDVDEYKVYRGYIHAKGHLELPEELKKMVDFLESNQIQLEKRLDHLISIIMNQEENSFCTGEDTIDATHRGDLEEKKDQFFQTLKEAEDLGKDLKTTVLKEMGGRFSSAVSYSYSLFSGWKDALNHYQNSKR